MSHIYDGRGGGQRSFIDISTIRECKEMVAPGGFLLEFIG